MLLGGVLLGGTWSFPLEERLAGGLASETFPPAAPVLRRFESSLLSRLYDHRVIFGAGSVSIKSDD